MKNKINTSRLTETNRFALTSNSKTVKNSKVKNEEISEVVGFVMTFSNHLTLLG